MKFNNLIATSPRIISILILIISCSPNPISKLDDPTKERVLKIKTYIHWANDNFINSKSVDRGKNERLIAYYNDQKELIKIKREIIETNSFKEFHFYFLDNQLIYSLHKITNNAKIKDRCLLENKDFYYSVEKTIFATQKSSTYRICSGEVMQKFERKTPKKLEAPGSIYSDELVIIEKLKNFINQKN